MLTKIKRIRRKTYATGDVARKFENIPSASQPQQGGLGTRNQNIDKYVTDQIKSPELASAATQKYTAQGLQSNELMAGQTMSSPGTIADSNVTKSVIAAPTTGTSAQTGGPSAFNVSTMTGATGTAQQGTAQTGTVGT